MTSCQIEIFDLHPTFIYKTVLKVDRKMELGFWGIGFQWYDWTSTIENRDVTLSTKKQIAIIVKKVYV